MTDPSATAGATGPGASPPPGPQDGPAQATPPAARARRAARRGKPDLEAVRRAREVLSTRDRRGRLGAVGDRLKASSRRGAELEGGARAVTAWVHGVVRHRRALHALIGGAARRALKDRPPALVAALELGAWRVLADAEPAAAVALELAALGLGKKPAAHVARVLGAVEAAVAERLPGPHPGADDVLPLGRGLALRLRRPLLEAERRGPAGRLALLHSLPDALVAAWLARHGEAGALALCFAANDAPPLFVRSNPLRTDPAALARDLAAEGVEAHPTDLAGALRLGRGRGRFRRTGPWRRGELTVQDLTAQRAAPLLDPRPGERVLDLCAAPGAKTTGLAERARDQAPIVACDRSAPRLRRVEENARRLGLTSIETLALDGCRPDALRARPPFDAVLLDAPCSNTGVLRRRPEARWRYAPAAQARLVRRQRALLEAARGLVAPGGRLVYSVCAIEPDEGEDLVRAVTGPGGPWRLEQEQLHLPSPDGGDGGYLALLRPG